MAFERTATRRATVAAGAAALLVGLAALAMLRARVEAPRPPSTRATETPATCRPDLFSLDYQVCVIDETGHPIEGVTVYGEFTRYGGSGPYIDTSGWAVSNKSGLAKVPRARRRTGDPVEMWAIADGNGGWPAQAEIQPGTIVMGPPRSLHANVHIAKPCTNTQITAGADNYFQAAAQYPAPLYFHTDLYGDGSFSFDHLGPGIYHVHVNAYCDEQKDGRRWSRDVRGAELVGRTLEIEL
jgi:hypothetical protein